MVKNRVFAIVITLAAYIFSIAAWVGFMPSSALAADPAQVVQLRQTKICQGCDLSRAYLVANKLDYAYLLSADLSRASLSFASLDHASLSRTNLSGAILDGAVLTNAKLLFANLSDANLAAADLSNANLNSANFQGTNLTGANLDRADLSYARNLTIDQVKSAKNWQQAIFSRRFHKRLMASVD
ncbi:pentapeptide repeat protein [Thalassoporum mexicanum PCC 7367]|uniref:pentapeptide repeat-containing protein n=1 Tax=Thalassoporum mexicanum TaxID=3457544 RepID=UPI00029F898D|nr:pentapeptide repeat-containing protein [Pseudanabaena sp. PCC 7367]AFY71694.1 pentapeptide repeat protein [Pseudanabaena sp. PCC 7367]